MFYCIKILYEFIHILFCRDANDSIIADSSEISSRIATDAYNIDNKFEVCMQIQYI